MDMQTYRDGREAATDAEETFRKALVALDVPERVSASVQPMVTKRGGAYVHVGVIPAAVAMRMAAAMLSTGKDEPSP